jgi:hypothetical protein
MDEFANGLNNFIQNAFIKCNIKLKQQLYGCPEKCRIALPQPMIDIFQKRNPLLTNKPISQKYNGVEVIPGYENAIIIYHVDWLYVNDPEFVFKIPFSVKIDGTKTTVIM